MQHKTPPEHSLSAQIDKLSSWLHLADFFQFFRHFCGKILAEVFRKQIDFSTKFVDFVISGPVSAAYQVK